ncbi:MAG: hypothetical protein M9887_02550 [Chitinophagales bacterium]|nr:hypothetical protein [Chitinophagales bacterium]
MNKGIKISAIAIGVFTLTVAGALLYINPLVTGALPDGFFNPITALEFVREPTDLISIFNISTVLEVKQAFALGNQVDYAFMSLYTLFIVLCTVLIYIDSRARVLFLVIPLAIVALVGDVFENMTIAEILKVIDYSNSDLLIEQLMFYTWLKWGSLASVMLIFSMYFIQGNWWNRVISLVMIVTFFLCIVAFFKGGIYCEIFSNLIVVSFLLLFTYVITWKRVTHPTVIA